MIITGNSFIRIKTTASTSITNISTTHLLISLSTAALPKNKTISIIILKETGCYFIQTERLIGQNLAERKAKRRGLSIKKLRFKSQETVMNVVA